METHKFCPDCKTFKPFDDFYKIKKGCSNGLYFCCKPCSYIRTKKWRSNNKERCRKNRIEYTKKNQEYINRVNNKWKKQNPEKVAQSVVRYYRKYPERVRAYGIVARAVKYGSLIPEICSICGSTQNIEAHHSDYSKPLKVVWLCHKCHQRLHKNAFPNGYTIRVGVHINL